MIKVSIAALALAASFGAAQAQTATQAPVDVSVFPAPKAGMTRHVFNLEPRDGEANYKVEIYAGQMMTTDCNTVVIGADFEEEDLDGYGYNYYVIDDVSQPAQTLMGCPDNKKVEGLVPLNLGSDAVLRYNSRMPIVVYAPENLTVGYRLWQTNGNVGN